MDPRVGAAHNKVPGEDQKFGWSSHCLDKDAAAFEEFSGSPLVKFVRDLNKLHREYDGGPQIPTGFKAAPEERQRIQDIVNKLPAFAVPEDDDSSEE